MHQNVWNTANMGLNFMAFNAYIKILKAEN